MTRATSPTPLRRTKIVATLGPAGDREGVLEAMLKTYVDNPGPQSHDYELKNTLSHRPVDPIDSYIWTDPQSPNQSHAMPVPSVGTR